MAETAFEVLQGVMSIAEDLYKCVNMYYKIEDINKHVSKYFHSTSHLTKKQRKSPKYMDNYYKKRKNRKVVYLNYYNTFEQNDKIFKDTISYGALRIDYNEQSYNEFIESSEKIVNEPSFNIYMRTNRHRIELTDDKLYISDISILPVIFEDMNIDFSIFIHIEKGKYDYGRIPDNSKLSITEFTKNTKLNTITISYNDNIVVYKDKDHEEVNQENIDNAITNGNI